MIIYCTRCGHPYAVDEAELAREIDRNMDIDPLCPPCYKIIQDLKDVITGGDSDVSS